MALRLTSTVRRQPGFQWSGLVRPNLIVITLLMVIVLVQAMTTLSFPDNSSEVVNKKVVPARLCPVQMWYHNETSSCWPPMKQGPCSPTLLFYPQDKQYGDCECERDSALAKCEDLLFSDKTFWVYNLSLNQCFKSYDQAYCKSGEWLIFDDDGEPTCVPNKCEEMQRKNPEENIEHPVVLYNNTCVRLSKPLGNEPNSCNLLISLESGKPLCSDCNTTTYGVATTGSFKCRPGTRRDRLGKCRTINTKVTIRPTTTTTSTTVVE